MGKKKEEAYNMESLISTVEFLPYNPVNKEEIKKEDLQAIREYIGKYDRNLILKSFAQEPCTTPLHDVCNCVDIKEANEMLKIILTWYKNGPEPPKEDKFIHKLDENEKNALQYAINRNNSDAVKALTDIGATLYTKSRSDEVKSGNVRVLKNYVDDWGQLIKSASVDKKPTPLHDICECVNKEAVKEMLNKVLDWYKRDGQKDIKFFDKQDITKNTALHYALENKNRYAVESLIECGASVHIRNDNKEQAITKIYELYPKTIMALLDGKDQDKCITFGKYEDQEDDDDDKLIVTCDFGAVIGIDLDRNKVYETFMLSKVLHLEKQTNQILDYPIVAAFLDLKWNKMQWLIYFSMAFHTTWSIISSCFIYSIFMKKYGNNETTNVTLWEELENKGENLSNLEFDWTLNVTLFILTVFMSAKEIAEFKVTHWNGRKIIYFKQMENWSQVFLIGSIIILMINLIINMCTLSNFLPVWLDYNLSIAAVMASCLLVLGQLNKQPRLGFYMAMFKEVLGNFKWLFLWFSPIFVAFTVGLHMLMPLEDKFQLLWLPFGLIKTVAMATGEYNYDDIYEQDIGAVKIPKNILIFFFITMVGIVLSNLLVGLVVSDLESLQKKARVNSLATQLEQMYLMEAFITKWMSWYTNLADACKVTEEVSFTKVWPINWLNCFWEKTGMKYLWNMIANKPSHTSLDTERQQPSRKGCHIIKAQMKEFDEKSKIRLMELKRERDDKNDPMKFVC